MELKHYLRLLWCWLWLLVLGAMLAGATAFVLSPASTTIKPSRTVTRQLIAGGEVTAITSQVRLTPLPGTPSTRAASPTAEALPSGPPSAGGEVKAITSQVHLIPSPDTSSTRAASPTAAEPTPSSSPPSAAILLQQVAEAEAAFRTGQLEATISFSAGQRSAARVRFDLGDAQRLPRFQITTTYTSTDAAQTTQRITIGDQSWQRQQAAQWTVTPARESALKQLQVFLPRTDSISDDTNVTVKGATGDGTYALRWYDAARDADVTLTVDTSGIPRQLRRVSRANGLVLTVTYTGWNTTVEIPPPAAS